MLEVRPLRADEIPAAALVIARGMAENPIHVAAWPDPAIRSRALTITFSSGQEWPPRWALGAVDGGEVIGVAGIAPGGSCRPSASQTSVLADRLSALGRDAVECFRKWRAAWRARDLTEEHWHFGPFAVLPDRRSGGIGTRIMEEYCGGLDESGVIGYLEADRRENLRFYERYGFAIVDEEAVLGVPTWYMRRDPG